MNNPPYRTFDPDAAKVAAQINAQMAASAYSTIQANAQVSTNSTVSSSQSIIINAEAENTVSI